MINKTDIATTMTRAFMPALLEVSGTGAAVSGRRTSAGCVVGLYGVRVPAFPILDTFAGVRAWSPPV